MTVQMVIMWAIGVTIGLAIRREMEPTLLLPMDFGCILCNMPGSGMVHTLQILFQAGVDNEPFRCREHGASMQAAGSEKAYKLRINGACAIRLSWV